MTTLELDGKRVSVWPGSRPGVPAVYLNTYGEEGQQVRNQLDRLDCPDFSLIAVSGLDWNRDLSPWLAPAIRRGEEDFAGGAGAYLDWMTGTLMPALRQLLPGDAPWQGIAGYSMAGLFAVWAMTRTGLFRRGASVSGSLWYPGLRDDLTSCPPRGECLYFSVGNKESKTRNPVMSTVEENTRAIEAFCRERGMKTVFQLNPGNHFRDGAARTAAGIAWLLAQ